MLNVLRMEWYRMLKSKATWVTLIIFTAIFSMLTVPSALMFGDSDLSKSFQKALGIESAEEIVIEEGGFVITADGDRISAGDLEELMQVRVSDEIGLYFQNNGFVLFIAIFMGIFATGHTVTGFSKNIAGNTRKWQLVLSDFLMSLTYSIITVAIGAAVFILALNLAYEHLVIGNAGRMIVYLLIYVLLNTAFGMLSTLIATLTRNRAIAITAPLVWVCMLATLIYELVNMVVVNKLDVKDFTIYHYLPYGNMYTLDVTSSNDHFVCAAVSAVIVMIVCAGISILVGRKQDVK